LITYFIKIIDLLYVLFDNSKSQNEIEVKWYLEIVKRVCERYNRGIKSKISMGVYSRENICLMEKYFPCEKELSYGKIDD